ncbi:MAG: hypothetical protein KGR98_11610 [Verrucomicrobia bacterium]|nr:hypothetical protein [Verrucomicrobiota bacterium]
MDDSDLEPDEARLDWLHTQVNGSKSEVVKAEVEHAFGLMTMELEVPYEYDTAAGETTKGFDNIDLGARYSLVRSFAFSVIISVFIVNCLFIFQFTHSWWPG